MQIRHILNFVMLMLLLLLSLPALAAGNSEIRVNVPSKHTITAICGEGGTFTVNGSKYSETSSFTVARHSSFTISAYPYSGYELVSVSGDSICDMTFTGNSATIKKVSKDLSVTVLFRYEEKKEIPVGIFIPVTSKNDSLAAGAVITDNEAVVDINESEFDEFLDNDTDIGDVSVDISNVGVDINTVVIPVSAIRTIAEKKNEGIEAHPGMKVKMPGSEATFDSAALTSVAEQAGDDNVMLCVEEIDPESLNTVQQTAIAHINNDKVVVTITLKSGETYIDDFEGGSVDVKLPYLPKPNEDTETITVWFVSEDGVMEEIPCIYENFFVSFTVYHFSDYIIKPGSMSDGNSHCFICNIVGHDINPWCWLIPICFIILAVIAVFAAVFSRRNKQKIKY